MQLFHPGHTLLALAKMEESTTPNPQPLLENVDIIDMN